MATRTNVAVYSEYWSTFGGGEKYVTVMADSLACTGDYAVTLLTSDPSAGLEKLGRYFDVPLEGVAREVVPRARVRKRLAEADIAIIVSNFRSYGTPSPHTIYVVQIPYGPITPLSPLSRFGRGNFTEGFKDFSRLLLLRSARKASTVLVYSDFVKETLRRHHRIDARVLHPPIDDFHRELPAQPVILSVGRFFRGLYNDKRYDMMIEAFKQLTTQLSGTPWEYRLVGSCADDEGSRRYLAGLQEQARGFPVSFHVNAPYDELRRHYNEATLFWHAAGYGVDEVRHPERLEHFGMSTVEAMSAGCVPIVINKGGQKEIVSHGESGYLWNTTEELLEQTITVIRNRDILPRLRQQARHRFRSFTREQFSRTLVSLIRELTTGTHGKDEKTPHDP